EIQSHQEEQVKKRKHGAGHWEEQLASQSESIVKADRNESGKSTEETIKQLKEEAKKI
ncbi:hypothetical protein P152DRAFT_364956, partial [Eremomyces bilateralis CBS 781.70]